MKKCLMLMRTANSKYFLGTGIYTVMIQIERHRPLHSPAGYTKMECRNISIYRYTGTSRLVDSFHLNTGRSSSQTELQCSS
ncbi:hypothetical protein GDO78_013453 [Eleutherodactylus coqui]|uniref:Uncharacterized protein n=1 Tax=Eleutherodactylus coqui TaxID=57060 RepID=A0A8J6F0A7_ELECQ|nr:hypothetical protein GDO78_013453 [Eleutherodactylus coqui]